MPSGLDIAFFGSSLVSAYWNGAATYYRGIIRELHARGHRVTFYEPDAFDRQKHRDISDPGWARVVVYDAADANGMLRALDGARRANVIVKASGVGIRDAELESAVLEIRRPDAIVVFWDVDAPATLRRLADNPDDPFRLLIRRYDLILTYGGGPPVVQAYRSLGARSCVPIYNGLDPRTHFPSVRDGRFDSDLALLANRLPDREERIEEFFVRPAASRPERRFLLGGSGWADKPFPRNVTYIGHVYTSDHNRFNSSPLAVLNVNRESMALIGYSPATRVFEAAGAGACLISDSWPGIELFLEPGREILVAASGEEVAAHLDALAPNRARAIGALARWRVLAEHSYAARVSLVERALAGAASVGAGAA